MLLTSFQVAIKLLDPCFDGTCELIMQRRGRISRLLLVPSGHLLFPATPHVTQMDRIMWRAYMLFEDREKNENSNGHIRFPPRRM